MLNFYWHEQDCPYIVFRAVWLPHSPAKEYRTGNVFCSWIWEGNVSRALEMGTVNPVLSTLLSEVWLQYIPGLASVLQIQVLIAVKLWWCMLQPQRASPGLQTDLHSLHWSPRELDSSQLREAYNLLYHCKGGTASLSLILRSCQAQ